MSGEWAGSGLGRLAQIGFSGKVKVDRAALRAVAAEKVRQGAALTRPEVAAFLDVNEKKLYRMERRGELRRCPGLAWHVRYAARDVLRLASANGKEA